MEEKINSKTEEKKKSAILAFLWKHKLPVLLIAIICAMLLYYNLKISGIESEQSEKLDLQLKNYKNQIDSLNVLNAEQTVKVFSWAIRSEMIRNNIEQVDQFFLAFIKEKGIEQIDLIDPQSAKIILSTDKKQEGMAVSDKLVLQIEETVSRGDSLGISILSPIMGLGKKIAVLSIEIKK